MTAPTATLSDRLEELEKAADQTDDDIRYYSGGSKYNEHAERFSELCRDNLPTIISALRSAGL